MNLLHDGRDNAVWQLRIIFFPSSTESLVKYPSSLAGRYHVTEMWPVQALLGLASKIPPIAPQTLYSIIHWMAKPCRKHQTTRWNK